MARGEISHVEIPADDVVRAATHIPGMGRRAAVRDPADDEVGRREVTGPR